uniref:Uncharacterized protein n=1 Tax=Oryza punctata TaxID=4537 RepID=A0A0E0L9U4_ORYPU
MNTSMRFTATNKVVFTSLANQLFGFANPLGHKPYCRALWHLLSYSRTLAHKGALLDALLPALPHLHRQGVYNTSLQAFSADQLDIGSDDDGGSADSGATTVEQEQRSKVRSVFFQWWYIGMCNIGWGISFTVPAAVMAVSVVAFFCCTPLYKQRQPRVVHHKPCRDSVLKALKSLLASFTARKITLPSKDSDDDTGIVSELE